MAKNKNIENFDLISEFDKYCAKNSCNWNVKGLITEDSSVISLGTDSKLIGRIFELLVSGILKEIASINGFDFIISQSQTVYPDFTFADADNKKIAIDVKTTYQSDGDSKILNFTLGSYCSFLRNGTKNIQFNYDEYVAHFVIGFVYTRNKSTSEGNIYEIKDISKIEIPYTNVFVFVKEKYKLSGETPGSGNTENIGSFKVKDSKEFQSLNGPFEKLGNDIFEDYWRNYPMYRDSSKNYTNISGYFDWLDSNGKDTKELRKLYSQYKSSCDML